MQSILSAYGRPDNSSTCRQFSKEKEGLGHRVPKVQLDLEINITAFTHSVVNHPENITRVHDLHTFHPHQRGGQRRPTSQAVLDKLRSGDPHAKSPAQGKPWTIDSLEVAEYVRNTQRRDAHA
ncbi:hypothetical protein CC2G_012319 [Coprinopsis cinerea AmutBmut pab1-1]|nr:hypothetical protein CC2G_012319 [Coprinopsis cinerea AmutBmut pab1-1]